MQPGNKLLLPSDLPSIWLLYLLSLFPFLSLSAVIATPLTHISISFSFHAVNFVTLSPTPPPPSSLFLLRRYLAFIRRFKAACPSHPQCAFDVWQGLFEVCRLQKLPCWWLGQATEGAGRGPPLRARPTATPPSLPPSLPLAPAAWHC